MKQILIALCAIFLFSCNMKQKVDMLVYNATVYTVDSSFSKAEAFVVDKGKIVEVGTAKDLQEKYSPKEELNAEGKFIFPGIIDAHAHFLQYGLGLQNADLRGTNSWDEIIEKLRAFASENKEGWIVGRGWDQNDWAVKEFPGNEKLNELFPDRPVVLSRIDGHAAIANKKALEIAGLKPGDQLEGGMIEARNGVLDWNSD